MQVIIPVAGKGTRNRPHSYPKPKSLQNVAGKTVIQHLVDHLRTVPLEEVVLVHDKHNGDAFKEALPRLYSDVTFRFVQQNQQLGSAHSILQAKPYLASKDLFILFCDTIFKKDLQCLYDSNDNDGVIFVQEVKDYQRFGVVTHKDRVMTGIVEKPKEPISKLANIGAYYLRDGVGFMAYVQRVLDEGRMMKGEYFLTEAFAMMVEDGKRLHVENVDVWLDVGTRDAVMNANRRLLNGAVWRGDNVVIENVNLANVVLGDNSVVRNGTLVNVIIGKNSYVDLCGGELIDSCIGDNVRYVAGGKKVHVCDDSFVG